MLIEEQIKSLLRVKAKVDLYKKIISTIEAEKSSKSEEQEALNSEFPGLLNEFCGEILTFCSKRVDDLGNMRKESPSAVTIVDQPQIPMQSQPVAQVQAPAAPTEEVEPTDPLKFLLKYRHMDGKRVTVTTRDGNVEGTVRGMVAPNIKVETDTGYIVGVPPRTVKIIG